MTETMITLFAAELQKYGRFIASLKCWSVGCTGKKLGFSLFSWSVGWNALANIQ